MRISLLFFAVVSFANSFALNVESLRILKTRDAAASAARNENSGSVAKNTENKDVRLLFTADVVLPSSFKTTKNPAFFGSQDDENSNKQIVDENAYTQSEIEFDYSHHERSLQHTAHCTPTEEGNLICVIDDSPAPGLLSIFDCPAVAETLMDCDSSCMVFVADNVNDITVDSTTTCLGCSLCNIDDQAVYSFDCSNMSNDRCAQQDCRGGCVETNDGSVIECFPETTTDSSLLMDCALENAPRPGLVAVFRDCPADTPLTSVLQCNSCEIVEEDSLAEVTDSSVRCASCNLCVEERDVAFDCSNFHPEEPCAIQDCNSNCVNTMPPWPTPEPTTVAPEPTTVAPEPTTTTTTVAPVVETTTTPNPTTDDDEPLIAPPFGPVSSASKDDGSRHFIVMLTALGAIAAGVVFLE